MRGRHLKLTPENYKLTSHKSGFYNCIAHALGEDQTRYEPGGVDGTSWPSDIDQSDSVQAWREFYERAGFVECESRSFQDGFQTIAIYSKDGEGNHVARALANGRWTSKLGVQQDIEHELDALEDPTYGNVTIVMRRAEGGEANGETTEASVPKAPVSADEHQLKT